MSRITDFIEWLKEQVGSIYVWGGQGEIATEDKIRKMETNQTNINRALTLYRKRLPEGKTSIKMYDCSGLIVCYFLKHGYITADTTAAGLYEKCKAIKQSDLKAGDLVFRHNGTKIHHVGVYIGNGEVIHAMGRDVGVVRQSIYANSTSYWNRYGRYEELQESEETKMKIITKTSPLMRGEDIKKLQTALNALGYDCGNADGIVGDKTMAAIKAFAKAHSEAEPQTLTVSVIVGSKTYKGEVK